MTWEQHQQEASALLKVSYEVLVDESITRADRVRELNRVLPRLAGHLAALDLAAESDA